MGPILESFIKLAFEVSIILLFSHPHPRWIRYGYVRKPLTRKKKKKDVNGANNHHDPFPDTNDHLGYRQVACKQVSPSPLWDRFEVQICDWDDSQFGRTIRDGIGSCGLQTQWKYEDSTFKFADGYSAQKYASLRMPTVAGRKCITHKIEEALGLSQGSVTCNNDWNEVSMF